MTAIGWAQIGLYCLALLLVTKPLGVYMLKVYDGTFRWLAGWSGRSYRMAGIDPEEDQHWTRTRARCCSSASHDAADVPGVAPAARPAVQSGSTFRRCRPAVLRDRGVVHDEHELAVVLRRVDDVVLLADDAAHVSQLRGRGRHGHRDRARSWSRASRCRGKGSGTSGRTSCAARSTCCCRSRS